MDLIRSEVLTDSTILSSAGLQILQDPSIDGSGKTQGPNRSDFFEALRIRNSKGFNLFGFLKDLGF